MYRRDSGKDCELCAEEMRVVHVHVREKGGIPTVKTPPLSIPLHYWDILGLSRIRAIDAVGVLKSETDYGL